jgi:hypothetical protein
VFGQLSSSATPWEAVPRFVEALLDHSSSSSPLKLVGLHACVHQALARCLRGEVRPVPREFLSSRVANASPDSLNLFGQANRVLFGATPGLNESLSSAEALLLGLRLVEGLRVVGGSRPAGSSAPLRVAIGIPAVTSMHETLFMAACVAEGGAPAEIAGRLAACRIQQSACIEWGLPPLIEPHGQSRLPQSQDGAVWQDDGMLARSWQMLLRLEGGIRSTGARRRVAHSTFSPVFTSHGSVGTDSALLPPELLLEALGGPFSPTGISRLPPAEREDRASRVVRILQEAKSPHWDSPQSQPRPAGDRVLAPLAPIREMGRVPPQLFNDALWALRNLGQPQRLSGVVRQMRDQGAAPDAHTATQLTAAAADGRAPDRAQSVMSTLKRFSGTTGVMNQYARALFRSRRYAEALGVFRAVLDNDGGASLNVSLGLRCVRHVLHSGGRAALAQLTRPVRRGRQRRSEGVPCVAVFGRDRSRGVVVSLEGGRRVLSSVLKGRLHRVSPSEQLNALTDRLWAAQQEPPAEREWVDLMRSKLALRRPLEALASLETLLALECPVHSDVTVEAMRACTAVASEQVPLVLLPTRSAVRRQRAPLRADDAVQSSKVWVGATRASFRRHDARASWEGVEFLLSDARALGFEQVARSGCGPDTSWLSAVVVELLQCGWVTCLRLLLQGLHQALSGRTERETRWSPELAIDAWLSRRSLYQRCGPWVADARAANAPVPRPPALGCRTDEFEAVTTGSGTRVDGAPYVGRWRLLRRSIPQFHQSVLGGMQLESHEDRVAAMEWLEGELESLKEAASQDAQVVSRAGSLHAAWDLVIGNG